MGSDTVRAARGSDSVFTGTIKNLAAGQYSTVTITAVDSSAAHNSKTASVRIKYDGDATGPVMTRVTPAKDSVTTNASSYTVTITCTDPSGVPRSTGPGRQSFTGVTRGRK